MRMVYHRRSWDDYFSYPSEIWDYGQGELRRIPKIVCEHETTGEQYSLHVKINGVIPKCYSVSLSDWFREATGVDNPTDIVCFY